MKKISIVTSLLVSIFIFISNAWSDYPIRHLTGNLNTRNTVFESFLNPSWPHCQNAGSAIKVIDQAYKSENKPVLFLEQYVATNSPVYPTRYYRWWTAYGSGVSAAYPLVMVDSGNQIHSGPVVDYSTIFAPMVDASLERNPMCAISATSRRVDDYFLFEIEVTNLSGITLSSSNRATIHAMAYEINAVNVASGVAGATGSYVRSGVQTGIDTLGNGASARFSLETPDLSDVEDWQNVHTLVIVDYQPNGTGSYDTLQAAFEIKGVVLAPIQQLLLVD